VLLASGALQPIDQIAVGDHVLAWCEQDGRVARCRVSRVFVHQVSETLRLHLADGEPVDTTWPHRFGVPGGDFVAAGGLRAGDLLVAQSPRGAVAVKRLEPRPGAAVVYNLTVEGSHTYYVGTQRLLVHNRKDEDGGEEDLSPTKKKRKR
jgi:hypothetical protein